MRRLSLKLAAASAMTAASIATAFACSEHATKGNGHEMAMSTPATRPDARKHPPTHGGPAAVVLVSEEAASSTVTAGDLEITGGWARAMLPGQPAGGAYATIANKGGEPDRLVAASSPAAGKVEIHTMAVVNDVMTMRPVEGGLEIPAGGKVEMKPGGFHMMFMQVSEPFKKGGEVAVTLEFEKAGKVELKLPVKAAPNAKGHSTHGS